MDWRAENIKLLERNGFHFSTDPDRWEKELQVGRKLVRVYAQLHGAGVEFFAYDEDGRLPNEATAVLHEVRRVRSSISSRGLARLDDFS